MGERSCIFVRIRAKEHDVDRKYKYEACFGLYFQWCYGERIISRLRQAVDFAKHNIDGNLPCDLVSKRTVDKFVKYLSVNFDMRTIQDADKIVPSSPKDFIDGSFKLGNDVFAQHENHGFLYIDISMDDPDGGRHAGIKYAFVQNECDSGSKRLPCVMDVTRFADRDIGNGDRKWFVPDPSWDLESNQPWGNEHKRRFLEEVCPVCKGNIDYINEHANVMTAAERNKFVAGVRKHVEKIEDSVKGIAGNDLPTSVVI